MQSVDDRVGLAVAVLCVLVAGREGPGVYEKADTVEVLVVKTG